MQSNFSNACFISAIFSNVLSTNLDYGSDSGARKCKGKIN